MVGALAGQGRIAAGEGGAVGREEWVEDGLALVGLPEIAGEGRAVDGDVDAVGGGVDGDGDAFPGGAALSMGVRVKRAMATSE